MRQPLQHRRHRILVQSLDLAGLGQTAARQQRGQRQALLPESHRHAAIQSLRRQPSRHLVRRMAGTDLDQVAGLPACTVLQRLQFKMKTGFAHAARVEQAPSAQPPALVLRRLPVRQVADAGKHRQMVLPVAQAGLVLAVHFHRIEQRPSAAGLQPALQLPAEAAVILVVAVAQREQSVTQPVQLRRSLHGQAAERQRHVRRLAVAGGVGHEQHLAGMAQFVERQRVEAMQLRRHARRLQALQGLSRELRGEAGLAGVDHLHTDLDLRRIDSRIGNDRDRIVTDGCIRHRQRLAWLWQAPAAQPAEQAQPRRQHQCRIEPTCDPRVAPLQRIRMQQEQRRREQRKAAEQDRVAECHAPRHRRIGLSHRCNSAASAGDRRCSESCEARLSKQFGGWWRLAMFVRDSHACAARGTAAGAGGLDKRNIRVSGCAGSH